MTKADVYKFLFDFTLLIVRFTITAWFPVWLTCMARGLYLRQPGRAPDTENANWLIAFSAFMLVAGMFVVLAVWWARLPDAPMVNAQ